MVDHIAMTVSEFCRAYRVSRARFYLLLSEGRAPQTYLVGCRRYIRTDAAKEWQARLEEEELARRADLQLQFSLGRK